MRSTLYLLFFAGLLILGACLDEIELRNQVIKSQAIIIQGKLIKGEPSVVDVIIQRIGDYTGLEIGTYLSGAKVNLVNGKGQQIELLELRTPRVYRASIPANSPNFAVIPGETYQIKVALLDGRQYESKLEVLPAVPDLEQMGYSISELALPDRRGFINPDSFLQFWIKTQLKTPVSGANLARLRWEIHMVYRLTDDRKRVCYNDEPQYPYRGYLYDGTALSTERLDSFFLDNIRLDFRFAEGAYLSIIQESLSAEAFEYWNRVKVLAERTGNMFESPPAKINSNIRNVQNPQEEVYGYFYATAQDTLRRYISPREVGLPRTYCPQPPTDRIGPTICDNCLLQTGSSLSKPKFWIQ
jgi:hypothetical protein